MHITIGIVTGLIVGLLIGIFVHKRRLMEMQRQINGLQERYNKEDYEAFWESMENERRRREEELEELEQDLTKPVPYLEKVQAWSDGVVIEEAKIYPPLKQIGGHPDEDGQRR